MLPLIETAFEHHQSRSRFYRLIDSRVGTEESPIGWRSMEGLDLGRCLTTCVEVGRMLNRRGTMPFTLFDGFDNLSWKFGR